MKRNSKAGLLLLSMLMISGITACGSTEASNVISAETSSVVSAEEASAEESSAAQAEHIDYVNTDKNCRLVQDYAGRDFFTEGITQVSLKTPIDGDTAHFTDKNGTTIKARFFGIDTPESTGQIQEWGKGASNFTKEKLEEANENGTIVLSSAFDDYEAALTDSTGSRYVSLVWVNLTEKNASYDSLVLLNLWIVQEGWSNVKNVMDMPRMQDTFYAAETQAKNEKLNMFSGEKDPLFNYEGYKDTSLLEIKREIEATLEDSTHVNSFAGANVRIMGTVAGYSNGTLYLENYYTKEQGGKYEYGEYAGINIYCGVSAVASKYTKRNAYISLCGTAIDSSTFGFQITDGQFQAYPKDSDTKNARVIIKADDNVDEYALHTFEVASTELIVGNTEPLNCAVQLTDTVKVTGGYASEDSNEITLYLSTKDGKSLPFSVFIPFVYHPTSDPTAIYSTVEQFKGKEFNLKGVYTFHKSTSGKISYQVNLTDNTDFTEVIEEE